MLKNVKMVDVYFCCTDFENVWVTLKVLGFSTCLKGTWKCWLLLGCTQHNHFLKFMMDLKVCIWIIFIFLSGFIDAKKKSKLYSQLQNQAFNNYKGKELINVLRLEKKIFSGFSI